MLSIQKLRADHVLDYAAEELKKYLRMMMSECGDIDINYNPEAKEGFRQATRISGESRGGAARQCPRSGPYPRGACGCADT